MTLWARSKRSNKIRRGHHRFKEAIRLNPDFADAHMHLGAALMMQQNASEAIIELTRATELSPLDVPTQIGLGRALIATGETEQAVPILEHAASLAPASLEAKYQLALALQGSGHERQSIPLFQEVLAAEPHNAPALTNLGVALVQTENPGRSSVLHSALCGNSQRCSGSSGPGRCLSSTERPR